jgi:transcription initiation factor TFIIF subunit alpha
MEATNVKDEMDSTSPAPTNSNGYTDYILRSSAPSSSTGWKFNVMKFATLADRVVDLTSEAFHAPVRLNRKDPRTVRRLNDEDIEKYSKLDLPVGVDEKGDAMKDAMVMDDPTLGPDGKPLKEEMDLSLVGRGVKGLAPAPKKKGMFKQQRTKRVYVASEEARRLKREEWMPWVLEDKDANERWIGRLEGGTGEAAAASAANLAAAKKANAAGTGNAGWRPTGTTSEAGGGGSSYVAFVFGENGDDFKVVPASRWYKFNQGPRYAMLGVDEAETEVCQFINPSFVSLINLGWIHSILVSKRLMNQNDG